MRMNQNREPLKTDFYDFKVLNQHEEQASLRKAQFDGFKMSDIGTKLEADFSQKHSLDI